MLLVALDELEDVPEVPADVLEEAEMLDGDAVTVDTEIGLDVELIEVGDTDAELEKGFKSSGAGAWNVKLLGTVQLRLPEPQQQAQRLVLKSNTMSCVTYSAGQPSQYRTVY